MNIAWHIAEGSDMLMVLQFPVSMVHLDLSAAFHHRKSHLNKEVDFI